MSSVLNLIPATQSVRRRCSGLLLLVGLVMGTSASLQAQAVPTATRTTNLQVGLGYVRTSPDYSPHQFNGFTVFSDLDLFPYFGVEAEFDRSAGSVPSISESTFSLGGRIRYPYRDFYPYLKLMAGIGSFSAGNPIQDGSYGMFAGGGGIEYWLPRKVTVRADYEYQRWGNFPPRGLQPSVASFGVAYRLR